MPFAAAAAPEDQAAVAAAIERAAAAAAPAGAVVTPGPVAGAGYMPACTGALAVAITGTEPYLQAAVHCPAPAWTLYGTVTVAAVQAVVVAARPIAAGQTIGSDDLTVRKEPDSSYMGRQVYFDPDALIGTTAAMTLPAGSILSPNLVEEPETVRAGQTVSVDVRSGGLDVSIVAVADQSGRVGDMILLTNPSSGRRFPAQVTRAGLLVQLQP